MGKGCMGKGLGEKGGPPIGRTPTEDVPPGLNWDIFLGPAPKRPYTKNRFHYNWHWFWDTGNGDIGNQGIHEMDIAPWRLGPTPPTPPLPTRPHYASHDPHAP